MKFSPVAALMLLHSLASFCSGQVVNEAEAPTANLQRCLEPGEFDTNFDYFPEKFVPHPTSDYFTITYHKSYKVVTNKYNEKSYLLYQCGTEPSADEVEKHHIALPIPHTAGVAVTQTPQIPPMELLGRRRDITAYIGNPIYISSPCLNYIINEEEESCSVIYDPENHDMTELMIVSWLQQNPDAIILGGPGGTNKHDERVVSVAASQERTNVAMFDWIGFYAALFNDERKATEIVEETEARYDCSADNAASVSSDLPDSEKPTMLWANYIAAFGDFPGGWSVAECPTSDATYYCENAKHCGINLLGRPEGVGFSRTWGGPTEYWYLSDEELLELGKDAEYWLYPDTDWATLMETKKEFLEQFRAVKDDKVFDNQRQGPSSWHEQRLAEYDVVALDMCSIVGNVNPVQDPPHVLQWFRNVAKDKVGSLGECEAGAVDEPYQPNVAECAPLSGSQPETETASASASSRASVIWASTATVIAIFISATF